MAVRTSPQNALRILMAAGVPKRREGGAAAILYQLANRLETQGHQVDKIFLEDLNVTSDVSPRFADSIFALRLAKFIRKNPNYSVVNLHAPWGFAYGMYRRLFSQAALPPYVMTMQGAEERYVHAMRREAHKGRATHFGWKNRAWHRAYHLSCYNRSIRTADYAIVANRESWAYLQLHHGLNAERVWFIPNGVDESFFSARDYVPQAKRLLFVGTWLDRKGIFYLKEAFVEIASKFDQLRLTIAGCFVEERVVRSAFPEQLQQRLEVLPLVPVEEMPKVYLSHDIFVFPSLMEGMPLSLLEAMAAGLPVVTTDTCGMSDVVEDEYNGLLVKPADSKAIVAAVERLMGSTELQTRLGCAAQNTMRRYTWDLIAERYLSVLQLAVASAASGK